GLEESLRERPHLREAHRALAEDVTTLVHGPEETRKVQRASAVLFGTGDPTELDERTLRDATGELPGGAVEPGASIIDALVATGLAESRGAARRTVAEGGASLNNVRVSDPEQLVAEEDFLHGRVALVRRGRRHLAAARRP